MIKLITAFFLLFITTHLYSQLNQNDLEGHWEGAVSREASVQIVKFDLWYDNQVLKGTYDIPEREVYEGDLKITVKNDSILGLNCGYGDIDLKVNYIEMQLTGENDRWKPVLKMHMKKYGSKEDGKFNREDITFNNDGLTLAGSILIPDNKDTFPMIVLIQGSGYTDRNSIYYHSMAYKLAQNGIGVFYYDKRGCGESDSSSELETFENLASDAENAIEYISNRKDINYSSIGILGTSQGGWIASIAANESDKVSYVILNVGPAVSVQEQELDRVKYQMEGDGFTKEQIDSAIVHTKLYFEVTNLNSNWEELKKSVEVVKKTEWKNYVQLPEVMNDIDMQWWRVNNYNPEKNLSNIKVPVLSILGNGDINVPSQTNREKMEMYLKNSGRDYKVLLFEGMSHDGETYRYLKNDSWDWNIGYWIWRRKVPGFYDEIIKWIREQDEK